MSINPEASHIEDCDCDQCCTHEITEWGRCAGCGASMESDREDHPIISGCGNRGWYHDGSEEAEALLQGRAPRPCPHH